MIIELTQGKFALVDDEYFEFLSQWKWQCHNGYAVRTVCVRKDGKRSSISIRMHRLVMNAANGEVIDHKNLNTLDNRKENLRVCTKAENNRNIRGRKGTSKYKGVCWDKNRNKWLSSIQFNNKHIHIGYFINEDEAAKAYNLKAEELFGEFALLNVIKGVG
jgi:hypothetical protein